MATTNIKELNIPAWGSEEARRKEMHVARFMSREYKHYLDNPVSIDSLGLSRSSGPLTERTGDLMEVHYDQEFFLFERFLDNYYLAYTMAYYGEDSDDVLKSSLNIIEAQEEKFKLIASRIGIVGDERILNIGCGFGSFERFLLETYPNIQVVGITPSRVQAEYIEKKSNDPEHVFNCERFKFIQTTFEDYASIAEDESFDLIVSIGFLEAVRNLKLFNWEVSRLLRTGGKAFHHAIVSKVTLPQTIRLENTMIGKYFPGSRVWPIDELPKNGVGLTLKKSWFINGMNYWKTLDSWHRSYWDNIGQLGGRLSPESISYWNDYFILCKGCFSPLSGKVFGNGHYLFIKPQ